MEVITWYAITLSETYAYRPREDHVTSIVTAHAYTAREDHVTSIYYNTLQHIEASNDPHFTGRFFFFFFVIWIEFHS